MKNPILIEQRNGDLPTDWLVSRSGSNPKTADCIHCADEAEAVKLVEWLSEDNLVGRIHSMGAESLSPDSFVQLEHIIKELVTTREIRTMECTDCGKEKHVNEFATTDVCESCVVSDFGILSRILNDDSGFTRITAQELKADVAKMGREVEILFMTRYLAKEIGKWNRDEHEKPDLAEKIFRDGLVALKEERIEGMEFVFTLHEGESFAIAKLTDKEQERLARIAYAYQFVQHSKGKKDWLLELGLVNVNDTVGDLQQALGDYIKEKRDADKSGAPG